MSVAAYAAVIAYVASRAHEALPATFGLGGIGALVLLFVLARANREFVAAPAAFVGVAYAIALVVRGSGLDDAAPLVAVGLLLCSELAAWSADERFAIPAERAVVAARAAALGGLAFASLAVAALVVALAGTSAGGGLAWTVLGSASAVGVVGIAVALARRVDGGRR